MSKDALLTRRKDGVPIGEAATYGMGLETRHRWGVTIVHHGGAMPGYKTDWVILPDAGIGVVLLTNGETGTPLLEQTRRRLVEILYDAHPEAAANTKIQAAALRGEYSETFSKLQLAPDPATVAKLARRYESPELGHIDVKTEGGRLIFNFGSFSSRMATKINEDGTISFVMVDPGTTDLSFVAQAHDAPMF